MTSKQDYKGYVNVHELTRQAVHSDVVKSGFVKGWGNKDFCVTDETTDIYKTFFSHMFFR